MKTSILIPYIRPGSLQRCMAAIRRNAGVSPDDFIIDVEHDEDRIGCPKTLKKLVDDTVAEGWAEAVMFLGDDTIPQKDFLKNAIAAMGKLPDGWGLVGLNDGFHDGYTLATHWLAHLKLLPLLDGEFFHTGYYHCFCDNELMARCIGLNRYIWAKDANIIHDNPIIRGFGRGGLGLKEDYKRVYSREYLEHDSELFIKRFQSKWKYVKEE